MIIFFVISFSIAFVTAGQGQSINGQENIVYPEFSGTNVFGSEKIYDCLNDYLKAFIQYPPQSYRCRYQSTEVVRFVVTTKGTIENITIVNSVCKAIDQELIRVPQYTDGKWKPGSINGEPIPMEKEVAVCFKINSNCDFTRIAKDYLINGNTLMYEKHNPHKAHQFFNEGIKLLPDNPSLLVARILCKLELGDNEGADRDWNKLKELENQSLNNAITVMVTND